MPKLRLAALTVNCGLGAAALVPLRVTWVVDPVDESLVIVSWPLEVPVAEGRYCTCSVIVWVGFSVTGKLLPPIIEKSDPLIAAELIVTGDVPVEVRVKDCVVDVFTVTLPKLKVAVLTANCGLGAGVLVPPRVTWVVDPVDESLVIVS